MVIHDDNATMEVEINGKIERRPFTVQFQQDRLRRGPDGPFQTQQARRVPEISSDERIVERIGIDIPLIIKVR